MRLHDVTGQRLYLNQTEQQRFTRPVTCQSPAVALLCLTLLFSGCRLSEALALTVESFDAGTGAVAIVTLKRRRRGVVREVPLPAALFTALDLYSAGRTGRLFPFHRGTAWRHVKAVMGAAGVVGPQAMPKGLRHGFAVNAIQHGVPLDLVSRWMGHASLRTTAIYTRVVGAEERAMAAKMWSAMSK